MSRVHPRPLFENYIPSVRTAKTTMSFAASSQRFPAFVPHPLVRGSHLQTIFGALAGTAATTDMAVRHIVDLDDGDRVVLHDDCPGNWRSPQRVALMLHGVTGSHASPYLVRATAKLVARGVRVFRLDMRGCGAGAGLADGPGHAGRSEDVAVVLETIAGICPASPVTVVGYSMGANIALKLLGEFGDTPPGGLDRAIAVAPPIDLAACCERIERGFNRIYERNFVRRLVAQARRMRATSAAIAAIPLDPLPRKISDFDDRYTAPLSGFRDVRDYYQQCSAAPLMRAVRLPTLVITAANDPLVPVHLFEQYERSAAVELHVTSCGGHLGFFGAPGIDPDRWWLDWRILGDFAPAAVEQAVPDGPPCSG